MYEERQYLARAPVGRASQVSALPLPALFGKKEIEIERGGNIHSINTETKMIFMCIFYPE
jgi:hypothetical protein